METFTSISKHNHFLIVRNNNCFVYKHYVVIGPDGHVFTQNHREYETALLGCFCHIK